MPDTKNLLLSNWKKISFLLKKEIEPSVAYDTYFKDVEPIYFDIATSSLYLKVKNVLIKNQIENRYFKLLNEAVQTVYTKETLVLLILPKEVANVFSLSNKKPK